jgi:hypothetical protein
MNIHVKALVYMVGIIGGGIAAGCLVHAVALWLGPEMTVNVIIGAVLAFLFYQMYALILSQLESKQTLEQLSKKD